LISLKYLVVEGLDGIVSNENEAEIAAFEGSVI